MDEVGPSNLIEQDVHKIEVLGWGMVGSSGWQAATRSSCGERRACCERCGIPSIVQLKAICVEPKMDETDDGVCGRRIAA